MLISCLYILALFAWNQVCVVMMKGLWCDIISQLFKMWYIFVDLLIIQWMMFFFFIPFPKFWSHCLVTMWSHACDRHELATIYEQFLLSLCGFNSHGVRPQQQYIYFDQEQWKHRVAEAEWDLLRANAVMATNPSEKKTKQFYGNF